MRATSRRPSRLSDAAVDELLQDFEILAFDGRLVSARVLLDAIDAALAEDDAERLYAQALFLWASEGPHDGARLALERAVQAAPDFADARHALGRLHDLQDNFEGMRRQFVEVLRLDTLAAESRAEAPEAIDTIEAVAREVLAELPEDFRARLQNVPVVLESRPHPGLVDEGFDPRALGLFEGLEQGREYEAMSAPTRIVLFYDNLLDAFESPEELAQEVEVTLLHEIGHFFGLGEDEVEALGLG